MATPEEEEEAKKAATGGLINDLLMGFGLKDRDQSYYDRTAATIGRNQGADAANLYRQQTGMASGAQLGSAGMPIRGGILGAFAGGGGQSGAQSRGAVTAGNFLPRLFGYRDFTDMTDRGGPFAFGGEFSGHPIYSTVANMVTDPRGTRTTYPAMGDIDQTLLGMGATQEMLTPMDYNQKMDLFRDMTRSGWKSGGQSPQAPQVQDPEVAMWINKLRSQEEWLKDRNPASSQGLLPPAKVEADTTSDAPYTEIDVDRAILPMLDVYNVPPASPRVAATGLTYSPQVAAPVTTQPAVDTTTQPEPAMNFAQYVEAYRKREVPLVKSGRLKRETPLDALRESYKKFYGLK